MTLIDKQGRTLKPYAAIPGGFSKRGRGDGVLICFSDGAFGRMSYGQKELEETNPPEVVAAHIKNLEEEFFKWCDAQCSRYALKGDEFRLEEGDLLPIGMDLDEAYPNNILLPEDTRTEAEFLEVQAGDEGRVYRRGRQ